MEHLIQPPTATGVTAGILPEGGEAVSYGRQNVGHVSNAPECQHDGIVLHEQATASDHQRRWAALSAAQRKTALGHRSVQGLLSLKWRIGDLNP